MITIISRGGYVRVQSKFPFAGTSLRTPATATYNNFSISSRMYGTYTQSGGSFQESHSPFRAVIPVFAQYFPLNYICKILKASRINRKQRFAQNGKNRINARNTPIYPLEHPHLLFSQAQTRRAVCRPLLRFVPTFRAFASLLPRNSPFCSLLPPRAKFARYSPSQHSSELHPGFLCKADPLNRDPSRPCPSAFLDCCY